MCSWKMQLDKINAEDKLCYYRSPSGSTPGESKNPFAFSREPSESFGTRVLKATQLGSWLFIDTRRWVNRPQIIPINPRYKVSQAEEGSSLLAFCLSLPSLE